MSLVNEMLNELQKEKSKGNHLDGMVAVKESSSSSTWAKTTTTFFFIILAIIAIWLLATNNTNNTNTNNLLADNLSTNGNPRTTQPNNDASEIKPATAGEAQPKIALMQVNKVAKTNVDKANQTNSLPIAPKALKQAKSPAAAQRNNKESISKKVSSNKRTTLADSKPAKKTINTTAKDDYSKKAVAGQRLVDNNANTIAARPNNKPMIKVSRKSQAEKQLRLIDNQWRFQTAAENKSSLSLFLDKFSELDTAWLGAINLVDGKEINYHQQLLEKALDKFPENPEFRMIVVKQQIAQNNFTGALSEIKKIERKLWQQNQYKIAGYLAQKVNDHIAAIRFYNQLLKSKPNQGDINMAIAISLEALNENSLAIAKFQRALEDTNLQPIQRQFIAQRIAVLKG